MRLIKPIGHGNDEYSMACVYLILMHMQQKAWYIRIDIKTDICLTVLCSLLSGLSDHNYLYQEEIELLFLICEVLMPHTSGDLETAKLLNLSTSNTLVHRGQL